MLVPKNLIFSQLRGNKAAALTSMLFSTIYSPPNKSLSLRFSIGYILTNFSVTYRPSLQKLRHHPGLQREKEQEVDQQRALQ